MMYWMTSKVLQNNFLINENDDDILDGQYVIVSSRIRSNRNKKVDNIIIAKAILFPDANVCSATDNDEYRYRYFNQCDHCKSFLASLILGSVEKGFNIIFICTHNERKLKYLKLLSDYVYMEFGYPIYEYKSYASGMYPLVKYNKTKIIKKCKKILNKAKNEEAKILSESESGRKQLMRDYKKKSKKELRKILKKRGMYVEGMDKEEMLDTLDVFM